MNKFAELQLLPMMESSFNTLFNTMLNFDIFATKVCLKFHIADMFFVRKGAS